MEKLTQLTRGGERRGGQANPPCPQNVTSWKVARVGPLLPERAASEGPRSTAAVGPTRAPFHSIVGQEDMLSWGSASPPL